MAESSACEAWNATGQRVVYFTWSVARYAWHCLRHRNRADQFCVGCGRYALVGRHFRSLGAGESRQYMDFYADYMQLSIPL